MAGVGTELLVRKRDGRSESFDIEKIESAVRKCFKQLGRNDQLAPKDVAVRVSNLIVHNGRSIGVEKIQDLVEQQLMAAGYFDEAKAYIIYRNEHRKMRAQRPISQEVKEAVAENKQYFKDPLQEFQFYDKYSRYRDDLGRRETWRETVTRAMTFLKSEVSKRVPPGTIRDDEWDELERELLHLNVLPSMRLVQMAGPALERCNIGVYNCSYVAVDSLDVFPEILYILMCGTGLGFSVESDYVDRLPRVKRERKPRVVNKFVIQDSTEGWCDALRFGVKKWFAGEDVEFDYSLVRPQGSRLMTKGGRASGPGPLRSLLDFVRTTIKNRQGGRLTTLDCHDIVTKIGDIVQVGGTRRAALLSLSDLEDRDMRHAKDGRFWEHAPWRSTANNSAVYKEKPSSVDFIEEWLALAKSGSGERGIFNRGSLYKQIPKRRVRKDFGVNPCGEVILRSRGLCNLSSVVARPTDSAEDLIRKARLATKFGTFQSMLTNFNYVSDEWTQNAEEERLLGVDITGQLDCPLLRPDNKDRDELLRRLRDTVVEENRQLAARLGINPSAATTVVKPSGNSAVLVGCSSGLHPRFAPYYIRRVRVCTFSPIARFLVDSGVPHYPEVGEPVENPSTLVFEFPVESPPGALTRDDLGAVDQLELWRSLKVNYTEHNPSVTVYVRDDEWLKVGQWVYENWDSVGGISFLPYDGGVYELAPYEAITQSEYLRRKSEFPDLDWSKLVRYETEESFNPRLDYACVAGSCEL